MLETMSGPNIRGAYRAIGDFSAGSGLRCQLRGRYRPVRQLRRVHAAIFDINRSGWSIRISDAQRIIGVIYFTNCSGPGIDSDNTITIGCGWMPPLALSMLGDLSSHSSF